MDILGGGSFQPTADGEEWGHPLTVSACGRSSVRNGRSGGLEGWEGLWAQVRSSDFCLINGKPVKDFNQGEDFTFEKHSSGHIVEAGE